VRQPEPSPPESVDERFRQLMTRPDAEIDLAEGALLIAKSAYADLDVEVYRARIEAMAQRLRQSLAPGDGLAERIVALNRFLFGEQGFGPSVEDYYDPRNSYLNDVLERRIGIPISLSVVYIEIGRRIGLPLQGVSFPGHFLVKCPLEQGLVVLDPYARGASLTMHDLQERLRDLHGGEVSRAIVSATLVAANHRDILARMLRNLKAIYLQRQDYLRALPILHWIIYAAPGDSDELRDRGMTYLKLECFRAALTDLEKYLEMAPAAEDCDEVRGRVVDLRRTASRLN
jgi:regulator of sirC expression with transglutaminase-like and TPR domain